MKHSSQHDLDADTHMVVIENVDYLLLDLYADDVADAVAWFLPELF